MLKIIEYFVRKGLFANLLMFFTVIVGLIAVVTIRREVFPNVTFDIITVTTIYPGATPGEVEKLITNPLEQDLKEVDGIKTLSSVSTDNRSYIVAQLDPDQTTDDKGKDDIQDVVDRFVDLPEGAENPLVINVETKLNPIIEVTVSGDLPELELRELARSIEDQLENVAGVARVVPNGMRDLEIRIEADPEKLARFRLSLDDVINSIRRQNVSIPGGTIPIDPDSLAAKERVVRIVGEVNTPQEIAEVVIRANDLGQAVKIKDVAHVLFGLKDAEVMNHVDGSKSISLTILKKEKSDAINVVAAVKEKVDEIKPTLPSSVKMSFVNDLSEYIERRLSILGGNLWVGLVLVILFLSLLLPFRVSLLVCLAIPVSFLGAMAFFLWFDFTINLISMIGLIIVSGMLVDQAIVVTDNAVRLMEEGMEPREAAIVGAQQMWAPTLGSVATTVIVFVPMLAMSGIFGKFVRQIPVGVIIPLLISLVQAFFVLPNLIATFVRVKKRDPNLKNEKRSLFSYLDDLWLNRVVPAYVSLLRKTLRFRYLTALIAGIIFSGTVLLSTKGMKFILFPPEGVEIFFIRGQAETGTSLEQMEKIFKPVEDAIKSLPEGEVKNFVTNVGIQQQDPNDPSLKRGSEYAQIAVYLTPETDRVRSAQEIIDDLKKNVTKPEKLTRLTFDRVNPGPPVGKAIDLGVRGNEYKEILEAVEELKTKMAGVPGVMDILDNYVEGKEELKVNIRPEEAAAAGLSVAGIGTTVRASFEGVVASQIRQLDEEIDIRVTLPDSAKRQENALESVLLPNPMGNLVPLNRVADVSKSRSLAVYEHEANRRQIRVQAAVDERVSTAVKANDEIRKMLPELEKKFPKVSFFFGGEDEDTKESIAGLFRALVLAVFGIYLVMVLIMGNLSQPFLILLTIPMGFVAVIFTFYVHGLPISFMGMLGIIALAGVIVNNAIVFIDFVNAERLLGADRWASLIRSAQLRVRPIFLTTATTVAGLLPTAYGIGGLDKFVVPIAMALGWGLLAGSILTVLVFPAAIAILDDFNVWLGRYFPKLKTIEDAPFPKA